LYSWRLIKRDWPQRKGLKSWSQSFSSYPDRRWSVMMAEFSEKDTMENLKQINERLARIEENIGFIIEILSRHDLK
jgi:hypothetical protein